MQVSCKGYVMQVCTKISNVNMWSVVCKYFVKKIDKKTCSKWSQSATMIKKKKKKKHFPFPSDFEIVFS